MYYYRAHYKFKGHITTVVFLAADVNRAYEQACEHFGSPVGVEVALMIDEEMEEGIAA